MFEGRTERKRNIFSLAMLMMTKYYRYFKKLVSMKKQVSLDPRLGLPILYCDGLNGINLNSFPVKSKVNNLFVLQSGIKGNPAYSRKLKNPHENSDWVWDCNC